MLILDGKAVSQAQREALKPRIANFVAKAGRKPKLVVVLVGTHLPSQVYVRNKVKACESVGMDSTVLHWPEDLSIEKFREQLHALEKDPGVDGVLVQLPLPPQLKNVDLGSDVDAAKDADGFAYGNLGMMIAGKIRVAPCTPMGVMTILKHYKIEVAGRRAVVVGRSLIVGKPMALLLLDANATVTVAHSKTKDLEAVTREADIVVVAAGQREFLGRSAFKEGAVVIDVGMHGTGEGGKLCGDVRFEELKGWASAATPVPGGVGPMTITTLLENTMKLAEIRQGLT
ncbi:MAG: bifunctional 5,10-methylenetetrahydrofolate dehydrogenase/5,10-methenyltetrahydrofolate cyclohydrolase [Bdellovibrionaceae bacterium]|nr:bifunctional 5,10-methylenetetrahydrofolate dehydrogenase/5,10-methenyltetrahydrofolate cyclohydrolase [Pseudobdellovibrionaceae bacterium]